MRSSRVTTIVTPNPDHVDHLLVTAEFEGGGYGTIEFSEHSFAYEVTVEVEAELGGVAMAPVMRPTVRRDGSEGVHIGTDWFARFADAYRVEDAVWFQSIAGRAAVGPSAWDGLVAERVVVAAIESLRERTAGRRRHGRYTRTRTAGDADSTRCDRKHVPIAAAIALYRPAESGGPIS